MAYIHGAHGQIVDSRVADATQAQTVAAYIGTAPVNLIRGYADLDLVNVPVKLGNMADVQAKVGYSADWGAFTLCEAFAEHFDNTVGNVGPIYIINVLDPDNHRAAEATTAELTFVNKRAEFESSTIILDTFAIADKVEGVDYALSYNYTKGTVVVTVPEQPKGALTCSYNTVNTAAVEAADIIGQASADGQYTGLQAFKLLYQYHNAVLNMLAAPGWSETPAVYVAMCSIVQQLNGHWDGFVYADIPLVDAKGAAIDSRAKAIEWKTANGYTAERSKVCWPKKIDGAGRVFHLSTAWLATQQRVDLANDNVPFETASNKQVMATAQYFGEASKNRGFDQQQANELNEKGISTLVFWAGQWVLWGPHTAAYTYGGSMDARAIFETNLRMLMHITNSFQLDHGTTVDAPMTPQLKDTILNLERAKLDAWKAQGALIGDPAVMFLEASNPVSDMVNGDFVWDILATVTPPGKSLTVKVGYTDEGFAAFFETV